MQSCLPTGGELKNYFTFFERIYLHSCLPTWAQQRSAAVISSVGVFTVMLTAAWSWRENVLHECKVTEKIWEKKEWIRVSSECWINWEFMWIYVTRSYCTVKNLIWLFGANKHWINKPSWIKKNYFQVKSWHFSAFSSPPTSLSTIWLWFFLFPQSETIATLSPPGSAPRKGEAAPSSGTSGRLPSVDRQRHPLKKQHLSESVKETLRGETASEAACGEASGMFLPSLRDFTILALGLIIVRYKGIKQVNLRIGWT